MKLTLAGLALALALFTVIPAHAQVPDEALGHQVVFTGTKLPANGYSCGRSTYPLYCYGVPTDDGGTFWLDVYYNAYPKPTGFNGLTNDGDNDTYSGTASFTFTYVKMTGGSGRGGGYPGYLMYVSGYTMTIPYN